MHCGILNKSGSVPLVHAFIQLGLAGSTAAGGDCRSRFRVESRLVEVLRRLRNIHGRVLREEAVGTQHHADAFHGHDGEVFDTGVVGEAEC